MPTQHFLVVGAQKAGTTTLHVLLRQHQSLWLPPQKEAPFFTDATTWSNFDTYMEQVYSDAPAGALLGGVNPQYMRGASGAGTSEVADRVRATLPGVKLIASLRDPVARAVSEWRMATRRTIETRSFDDAVRELLTEDALVAARINPQPSTSYLAQGEYGRILEEWYARFPPEHIHIVHFGDLVSDPVAVATGIHRFLGVDPLPPKATPTMHRSGSTTKVSDEQVAELYALLTEHVWPHAPDNAKRAFKYWFGMWNIEPDEEPVEVSSESRTRLRSHYRDDAQRLKGLGVSAPWLAHWD
ncbi:MAG: sulfotransferase [Dehalococcoidia bacterium]